MVLEIKNNRITCELCNNKVTIAHKQNSHWVCNDCYVSFPRLKTLNK